MSADGAGVRKVAVRSILYGLLMIVLFGPFLLATYGLYWMFFLSN